jgi:tetratricopeptide (TPR) repeat protein
MRAALSRAAELKPDFPETYRLLAWVDLVTGEQLNEGVEYAKKALALSPSNEHYALVLAQLHLRQLDFAAARRVVEPLAARASDPQTRANAQSLLDAVEAIRMQAARQEQMREAARQEARGARAESSPRELGAPRLRRREAAADAAQPEVQQTAAEALSEAISGARRAPGSGETRARGILMRIECAPKGVIFHVKVGARVLRLQAESFDNLHLIAYTQDAGGEVTCGERKPESHVVVTFRPAADAKAKSDGALAAVEFVPADFQLRQ